MINLKKIDSNNIKIDEKSYKYILVYYIGLVTLNNMKPLYLNVNKINAYIKEHSGNKYLKVIQTHENKDSLVYNNWGTDSIQKISIQSITWSKQANKNHMTFLNWYFCIVSRLGQRSIWIDIFHIIFWLVTFFKQIYWYIFLS